jgi:hypothetical protein
MKYPHKMKSTSAKFIAATVFISQAALADPFSATVITIQNNLPSQSLTFSEFEASTWMIDGVLTSMIKLDSKPLTINHSDTGAAVLSLVPYTANGTIGADIYYQINGSLDNTGASCVLNGWAEFDGTGGLTNLRGYIERSGQLSSNPWLAQSNCASTYLVSIDVDSKLIAISKNLLN